MNPSLIASGVILLSIGLPCMAMGAYYRKRASEERAKVDQAAKKPHPRKSAKSKREKGKGAKKTKDQKGKERGTSGGLSLILGGLAFTAIGGAMVVMGLKAAG